jgi:transglutaminase-like putative cysteine protease
MSLFWHTTNRFHYLYTTPVTGALTRLRVLPRVRHGAQLVVNTRLWIDPHPRRARSWTDGFGNCVVELEHPSLSSHLEVEAEFCTTALPAASACGIQKPTAPVPTEEEELVDAHRLFLPLTRLVNRSVEIESLADDLLRRCATDEELAWECMRRVYRRMRYLPGSTGVATPAADALAGRTGVCQDFAQVMLAVCRTAGLPARYVSGHLEGEGQMHAWVEILYAATGGPLAWHPLDPTHDRAALDGYVTVAVGRDYADVSPISGHCYGPEPGRLSSYQHMRRHVPEAPIIDACSNRL